MNSLQIDTLSRVLVIDTETGGLDPNHHSLLSLAMVSWDLKYQKEFFVREANLVTNAQSMEINQIDLDWIKAHGKSPLCICEQIEDFLNQITVTRPLIMVGHNIAFDLSFIKRLYHLANRPFPSDLSHRSIDTHSLLWTLSHLGKIPANTCSSDQAFKFFDVSPPQHLRHTALGDAVATRHLLEKILTYF